MRGDGDGWVDCGCGSRHWGRYGAAGLLVRAVDEDGTVRALFQHRAAWTHEGDTWGVPGGARDSGEDAATAAFREAVEETGVDTSVLRVRETRTEDHGRWSYVTVLADTPVPLPVVPTHESDDLRWVPEEEIPTLRLHPGLARSWPTLRARAVTLVVDGANVVGSRPDGWWRDRAAAAQRLAGGLDGLRARVARDPAGALVAVRRVVLVVEGAARQVAERTGGWAEVRAASGSGDDLVAGLAGTTAERGTSVLVVTADRGLRPRLPGSVRVAGPRWLTALLTGDPPPAG